MLPQEHQGVSSTSGHKKTPGSVTAQGGRGVPGDYYSSLPQPDAPINPRHVAALRRAISTDRFAPFAVSSGQDAELACRLYVWDGDLEAAILRDIAVVEVALRNALSRILEAALGPTWYDDRALHRDRRLESMRDRAKDELNLSGKRITSGRMTAQLTLGFWVGLLDLRSDALWRAGLFQAFPGGKYEARNAGQRYGRAWVHSQARIIQVLRNRCAHHETVLNGFPLPGQYKRLSARDGIAGYMLVARMIDRDLADWLRQTSTTTAILAARPQPIPPTTGDQA